MKKKDLILALSKFADDDHIMLDSNASRCIPEMNIICGGGQKYMAYYCVKPPGHEGDCYCGNKDVSFEKDKISS